MKIHLPVLLALLLTTAAAPLAQEPPPSISESLEELQAAIVIGDSPGPALWKVTHKDHTLWILPVFGPLPNRLRWRYEAINEVISESQAVYVGGRAPEGGDLRDPLSATRALMNVDGNILRDLLPADLHQRFTELSNRYAGGPARYERYRPYYAVEALREDAMARLGLTSDGNVVSTVRVLAERHLVKVYAIKPVANRQRTRVIEQLGKTPRTADVPCVRVMLERMDQDLRDAIERANSWSRGDLVALRREAGFGNAAFHLQACGQFWQSMKLMQQQDEEARDAMYSSYVSALRKNRSTLALVWAPELVAADGLVAKFRKAGYLVEEPASP